MLVPAIGNLLWNHRNPSIKALPIIRREIIGGREGEFTWIRWDNAASFLNSSGLFGVTSNRNESGLIWEGFSAGVSRESGELATFQIWIYGSDQGVGHFVWSGGSDRMHKEYGEGHIPMMMYMNDIGVGFMRKYEILSQANTYASRIMGHYYRPLQVDYKEETKEITFYDPESGRSVHTVGDSGGLVFGDYPVARGAYSLAPGISLDYDVAESLEIKQLRFRAVDVYGKPIRYVIMSISSDSGYSYSQTIPDGGTKIHVMVPVALPSVHVAISRGGYNTLETEIDLPLDGRIPVITAVLEPLRKGTVAP